MSDITIDATPDKSLIKKLGMVGYKTEQALAELIDNSIDARIIETRLHVKIKFDHTKREIAIEDNGYGMNLDELKDAWTIAKSTNDSKRRLGKFGLGMKSACSALGSSFTISTTKKGSNKELVLKYDENEWLHDVEASWSNIKIEEKDANKDRHGTIICIHKSDIPMYSAQIKKFLSRFGTRYGPYILKNEIVITINDNECVVIESVLKENTKQDIRIYMLDNQVISGWIGLLNKRSIKGDYGIHLYREGRLIELYAKFGIPKHPSAARVIGELDLDHVPVNVFKTKFLEETDEYKNALTKFKNYDTVKNILKQSAEHDYETNNYESILSTQNLDDISPITRVGDNTAQKILNELGPITTNSSSGRLNMRLGNLDGKIYEVERRNNTIDVIVNKNSKLFKAFRNPLFFLMMLRLEIETIPANIEMREFVQNRNKKWEQYLSKLTGDIVTKPSRSNDLPTLSYELQELHEHVKNELTYNFQFTALSTLSSFLHNAYNTMVYTIYTEKDGGGPLEDILNGHSEFIVLRDPNKLMLQTMWQKNPKDNIIVIREYSSVPTTTIASLSKSWVDLYFEVTRKGLDIYRSELGLVKNLISDKLANEKQINSFAKRRLLNNEITPYIERD